ncbi:MAG: DUF4340 domain-containing protein [Vicinamibacterales bacterium]
MRGGRSLIVLLAVALGLGAYLYFVESKRDLSEGEKKDKVFATEVGKIEALEVHAAGGDTTTLKKNGDNWQIVSPVTTPADQGVVGPLLNAIATTEVTRVLDDNPADVSAFGLQPARYSVVFHVTGDGTAHRLNIGEKTPTGSDLYARVEGQTKVLLIPAYAGETFNRTTFDLRDKTVLQFDRDKIDSVAIEPQDGAKLALAKKGDEWLLTAPIQTRADFSPVDGLVGRVAQAQMKSIEVDGAEPTAAQLKTFGLERPQLVTTFGSGSTRATLAIGGKKDETAVYARDLSRPLVFTVEATLLTDLQKKPDDLRLKDVFAFKSYTATALDVTHGTPVSFAKSPAPPGGASSVPDAWKQTKPEAKDVNATAMVDFLNTLSSLRAERFVDRVPASGDDMVVVVRSGDAASSTEDRVTLRKVGSDAYAIRGTEAGAAVIPAADFDKAVEQLKTLSGAK